MKKKALIVTYYWPPSGGAGVQRFLKFSKYLPQFGVDPVILTVKNPTYPILDESLEKDIPEGIKVFKSKSVEPFQLYSRITGKSVDDATKPTIQLQSNNLKSYLVSWIRANLFIPDARVGWLLTARSKALHIVKDLNISTIITTGPPHSCHFVGKYVQQHANIHWIADFRDPWTGVYYNQLMPRCSMAQSVDEHLEQTVLKYADEVIVVSDTMAQLQDEFLPRRYTIVPNGFDPDDFDLPSAPDTKASLHSAKKTIRFLGSVREGAIPEGFLKAVSKLDDKAKLKIEFIGNSHPSLHTLIHELALQDVVEDKPYIAHDEAIRLMTTADLLLLSISTTPNSELILTGKLFEYMGSGTPVLFLGSTTGDAAKIIRDMKQGVCFEYDEVNEIKKFLEGFLSGDTSVKRRKQNNLKEHPYSRVMLTQKLAKLIR